jgi:hypothetical protein
MMTPVEFHFVTPKGVPISNAEVEIQLLKSGFDIEDSGVLMPRLVIATTGTNGKVTVDLWSTTTMYQVRVFDTESDAGLFYKFYVPEMDVPGTVVRLQDIVVDVEMENTSFADAVLVQVLTARTNALSAKIAAETAATQAAASAQGVNTFATAAAASATAAAGSATTAGTNASTATTKANEASASATSAAGSATTATSKATEASTSAAAALTSQNAAAISATGAATSATEAATSATSAASSVTTATNQATIATTKATEASTSASNASGFATTASTKAAEAVVSASNAAGSATAASGSASSAASSLLAIQQIFDNFDDIYLGSKASNPTVDNDGNPLVEGQLYWNSTEDEIRFYNGAQWERPEHAASQSATSAFNSATAASTKAAEAAVSATSASGSASTATSQATTATTKATEASTSASNAASFATAAEASAVTASGGATTATTQATAASNSATAAQTSATDAASSATSATASKDAAAVSATTASTKASEASTSATSAQTSATTATTQAGIATTKATEALTSANNAANSANAAAQSVVDAADASRLTIGTVTTVAVGGVAAATITGEPGSQVLNLGLVTGPRGEIGPSTVFTGVTPPENPQDGWKWMDPESGVEYTWFDDGNSSQWVETGGVGLKGDKGDPGTTTWAGIADKPATFPPSAHTHAIGDVTGLQTALDGKLDRTFVDGALAYAATVNLDMGALAGLYRTLTLTGNVAFTTSNRAVGRAVVMRLLSGASARTLNFPTGWVFLGAVPTTLAANKTAVLSVTFFGTADTDAVVAYGVQP